MYRGEDVRSSNRVGTQHLAVHRQLFPFQGLDAEACALLRLGSLRIWPVVFTMTTLPSPAGCVSTSRMLSSVEYRAMAAPPGSLSVSIVPADHPGSSAIVATIGRAFA